MSNSRLFATGFILAVAIHRTVPFGQAGIIEAGLMGSLFVGLCAAMGLVAFFGDMRKRLEKNG